jgi:hypothetical protein
MISNILTFSLLAGSALAVPVESDIEKRIDCPSVHIFGARETSVSPGYGSSSTVVNGLLSAYSGSTAEAISYPACGGQSSCGGVSYSNSVAQGIAAVASAVNSYNKQCPSTKLVLVGYSQVSYIFSSRKTNFLRYFRVVKSSTQPCAAAASQTKATPTLPSSCRHPPSTWSRQPSSWVIHCMWQGCRIMLEHVLLVAYGLPYIPLELGSFESNARDIVRRTSFWLLLPVG